MTKLGTSSVWKNVVVDGFVPFPLFSRIYAEAMMDLGPSPNVPVSLQVMAPLKIESLSSVDAGPREVVVQKDLSRKGLQSGFLANASGPVDRATLEDFENTLFNQSIFDGVYVGSGLHVKVSVTHFGTHAILCVSPELLLEGAKTPDSSLAVELGETKSLSFGV